MSTAQALTAILEKAMQPHEFDLALAGAVEVGGEHTWLARTYRLRIAVPAKAERDEVVDHVADRIDEVYSLLRRETATWRQPVSLVNPVAAGDDNNEYFAVLPIAARR